MVAEQHRKAVSGRNCEVHTTALAALPPTALGRTLSLEGNNYEVVRVGGIERLLPRRFRR